MNQRTLGAAGPLVSEIGLGCMGMSGMYGPSDRAESIATIHAALDAGVTLFDTGDFYGMGHNEMLLGEALRGQDRAHAVVSVKFGALRGPNGAWSGYDGRPAAVKNFAAYSLQRLGVEYIDIYRMARVDPDVPIEETIGAIGELVDAGYVRHIGLSEAGARTIRRAAAVRPICDLQIEYSLISRSVEATILPTCRQLGIGITAYGVLSRGLISGHWQSQSPLPATDIRNHMPRFQGENLAHNLKLVDAIRQIALEKNITPAQLAIAWVASRGDDIIPLIGCRSRDRLAEALGATGVSLTPQDLERLDRSVPAGSVAGDRYAPAQMVSLDSERD